ncbi:MULTISPECIES: serine hydrolase [unclassified Streptomyces]|uniref:D-alanyl-D-alanine carboxypeptidase family protein n=1 Tax=unclassified Streptomyces TaxID=2593676 RepID=UPI00036CEA8B|nr:MULTISPECIES: serine hydrolase [unclassified Streptomyces]MYX33382.1 D-alanyl-D-alanine carboxypeptidase [Streptomyces sp. SID8377]
MHPVSEPREPGTPGTGRSQPQPQPQYPQQQQQPLAGPWNPPSRTRRSRRVPVPVAAGAAALVTLIALGAVVVLTDGGGDADGASGRSGHHGGQPGHRPPVSLPWPRQGQASVLVEGLGDGGDLGDRGAQKPVPIASVTKVMTAYVILRDHPLRGGASGPRITVDQQAADESVSGVESTVPLRLGQRLGERRLLELMLIPSGNNVARLLARWDAGSQEAFVAKMNRAAEELGMDRTTYTGASGIESTTTSTSGDQLKLARQVMRDPVFRAVVAQPSTTVPGVPGSVLNTNTLLGTSGVVGLKTGSSTPAGGALMWAATAPDRHGHGHLALGVVLHQRPGTSPQEGLNAALGAGHTLVEGVRRWVAGTGTASAAAALSGDR